MNETLTGCYATPLCEHCQIKSSCWYCKVEDQIKSLTDMYKLISIQCAASHEHKLNQIDRNKVINERLDKLEDLNKKCFEANPLKQIEERFEKLESHFSGDYQLVASKLTPHKCPVCNGKIKILIDPSEPMSGIQAMFGKRDINGMYYEDCKACNDKGVLWG